MTRPLSCSSTQPWALSPRKSNTNRQAPSRYRKGAFSAPDQIKGVGPVREGGEDANCTPNPGGISPVRNNLSTRRSPVYAEGVKHPDFGWMAAWGKVFTDPETVRKLLAGPSV